MTALKVIDIREMLPICRGNQDSAPAAALSGEAPRGKAVSEEKYVVYKNFLVNEDETPRTRMKAVQPRAGEILEVVSESSCVDMKVVTHEGEYQAMKFTYANGAMLYVPLPAKLREQSEFDVSATAGPARS